MNINVLINYAKNLENTQQPLQPPMRTSPPKRQAGINHAALQILLSPHTPQPNTCTPLQSNTCEPSKAPLTKAPVEKIVPPKPPLAYTPSQGVPEARKWKLISKEKPDFSYTKPQVDTTSLTNIPDRLKTQIEERCLKEMRAAMKALDPSIVDAANEMIKKKEHSEFLEVVNTFSGRVLDVYKAYTEILIEDKAPALPADIRNLKATGLTHQEILDLREPCKWYQETVNSLERKLRAEGLQPQEVYHVVQHIGANGFNWKGAELRKNKTPSALDSKIIEILDKYPRKANAIKDACNEFQKNLRAEQNKFDKIKTLHWRMGLIHTLKPEDVELIKEKIARFADEEPRLLKDPREALLQEIQARFEWRDFETGALGSPLRLLNVVEGKHDATQADQHYRTKLFFCYGSKGLINDVAKSPGLMARINAKLREQGKNWSIEEELAKGLSAGSAQPVFGLGPYAHENHVGGKIRHVKTTKEVQAAHLQDPEMPFAKAERIANKIDASKEDLMRRFRIKPYASEEMAFFGSTSELEAKEIARRTNLGLPSSKTKESKADTHFLESPLDYQKKTQQIPWAPGKHYFQLHDRAKCASPYLAAVEDLGLPQHAGISGSSDQTFNMAGIVGITSKEALMALRFAYLPWMAANEDHTVDEICIALKSFGLDYTPSADYYKQLYPSMDDFIPALEKAQKERGYHLPDHYLSKDYVNSIVNEETRLFSQAEAIQHTEIDGLLRSNKLAMQTIPLPATSYQTDDLFGDARWKKGTSHLKQTAIDKLNKKRAQSRKSPTQAAGNVQFQLNPHTHRYETHVKAPVPFYTGSKKRSLSLLPSTGKMTPYVTESAPYQNRVGLLYDVDACEIKADKFIFRSDANTDNQKKWKKTYRKEEIEAPGFKEKLARDSEEATEFLKNNAHQISMKELLRHVEEHKDEFAPYNEMLGSTSNSGIKGVFVFSKGLPLNKDGALPTADAKERSTWAPLHHESLTTFVPDKGYDNYMKLLGIGKRIAVREELEKDVPLYEINQTKNQGLRLVPISEQVALIEKLLADSKELDAIVRVIQHQSDGQILVSKNIIKNHLKDTLKRYLKQI